MNTNTETAKKREGIVFEQGKKYECRVSIYNPLNGNAFTQGLKYKACSDNCLVSNSGEEFFIQHDYINHFIHDCENFKKKTQFQNRKNSENEAFENKLSEFRSEFKKDNPVPDAVNTDGETVGQAAREYSKNQGSHDNPEITEHDFTEGAKWQFQKDYAALEKAKKDKEEILETLKDYINSPNGHQDYWRPKIGDLLANLKAQ